MNTDRFILPDGRELTYVQMSEEAQSYLYQERPEASAAAPAVLQPEVESYLVSRRVETRRPLAEIAEDLAQDLTGPSAALAKYLNHLDAYPALEEININGWNSIWLRNTGLPDVRTEETFLSPSHARDKINMLLSNAGSPLLNPRTPGVVSYITEGVRNTALGEPLVPADAGLYASIRIIRPNVLTGATLLAEREFSPAMLRLLDLCVKYRISCAISGEKGAGKTSVLNYLLAKIPSRRRVGIIEEGGRELSLRRFDADGRQNNQVLSLLTRSSKVEERNFDAGKLLELCLRFDLEYLVPQEMRDAAAYDALEASRTGTAVYATLHCNDADGTYPRIVSLCEKKSRELSSVLLGYAVEGFPISLHMRMMGKERRCMEYIDRFMADVLKTPRALLLRDIRTQYSDVSGVWNIHGKNADSMDNVRIHSTYGTKRRNAYYILEDSLNLKDVRIYDTVWVDGKEKRVLNSKETAIAQQKQEALRQAFQDWICKDPERRQTLVQKYNVFFNSTRPREYDGSHIVFNGMNPEIVMRSYQRNAIAHGLYGGNELIAHCVGAGKTFEMIAIAMESKRLGLCNKSLFAVPNHLTEQWGADFLRLYPGANVLVATKKDFEPENRKRFCARIATGDYDAVIIGHSQFEKIPVSPERQARTIKRQIEDIEMALEQADGEEGQHYTVKQLENTKKSLEARLKRLSAAERKDNVVTFEELGVDRLFVDEADNYKNLFLYTKMRNVAGIGQTEAQKSSDMYAKCQYMDELTGGRGTVFATGTPISNSMTELYTMMRYLQSAMLHTHGLDQFDSWAAAFGERVTAVELNPEGTGFRMKTRFARFFNLPELMSLWKEAADIQTADMLKLPVPKADYVTVVSHASDIQQTLVRQFGERAEKVHRNLVKPYEDNMLAITNDGRKLALDQRLMNPLFPDDPDSKVNACVKNIVQVWRDTAEQHGAQLLFCDLSTPHHDGKFNVYAHIRTKLIAQGVPADEIAYIHDAKTEKQKSDLFAKVRKGRIRVLLGSTTKMGAGTNVQDLLAASHHLDCPWRPRDLEQRDGRILRYGNRFPSVRIFRYVTQGTFDAYNWSLVENKQKFIGQVVTSKSPARSCEDVDGTALSYAEVKALATGDPRIKEKMDLDIQVSKLRMLQSSYASQKYELEDNLIKHYPQEIQAAEEQIAGLEADAQCAAAHPQPDAKHFSMVIHGKTLTDKKAAGEAVISACRQMKMADDTVDIGECRGFSLRLSVDSFQKTFQLSLRRRLSRTVEVGADALGNITRIEHALDAIPQRLAEARDHLAELRQQMDIAREEVAKPFPQENELTEKAARLQALNALLSVDGKETEQPAAQKRRAECER